MLRKAEVLQLMTAFARMNDADVISRDEGLPDDVCAPEDRKAVRDIRALVIPLRRGFEYTRSPEFRDSVAGKSPALRTMREKLERDPVRRQAHGQRFDRALEQLLQSDDAFLLLPEEQHARLAEIRKLARKLKNPD